MYCILLGTFFGLFTSLNDLRKFFVFSELVWLCIFGICLILSSVSTSITLYAQTLFILVFTACEAVILTSILLLSFEVNQNTLLSNTQL